MTQEEILQYNKMCAEFLGAEVLDDRIYIDKMKDDELIFHNTSVDSNTYEWDGEKNIYYIAFDMLQFHSDWNWIMEVVEAIEKLGYKFQLGWNITALISLVPNTPAKIALVETDNRKEAVVEAINQFLIWYEQNKTI